MKIGELSSRSGVSRDAIRFYEGRGLLTGISRPYEWNNYKDYAEDNVKRIEIIKYLQQFSFTLRECKELLDQRDASPNKCIDKKSILGSKLSGIEDQIKALQATRDKLLELIG